MCRVVLVVIPAREYVVSPRFKAPRLASPKQSTPSHRLHMPRHLRNHRSTAMRTRLDDHRVPRLLRHDVPTVHHVWLHRGVGHGRACRVGVVVASRTAGTARTPIFLPARVLPEPWQLDDRLVPCAVATKGFGSTGKCNEDPEENCD